MNQLALFYLVVAVVFSAFLSIYLWRAFIKHEKPSYDRIFMNGWFLLSCIGHILDNLSILPKGWTPYIAFVMLMVMVGYGLVLVSRMTAKRTS
ncbi:MAG: hypothetical protein J0I20_09705 [Chloroflexi bacterium]|nr:hypothetical protein [Chloroflexota bacterium]OJV94622.1 MAG: hypothetical protein BGO39_23110 [Chloroflexi bacterium 54-19]